MLKLLHYSAREGRL